MMRRRGLSSVRSSPQANTSSTRTCSSILFPQGFCQWTMGLKADARPIHPTWGGASMCGVWDLLQEAALELRIPSDGSYTLTIKMNDPCSHIHHQQLVRPLLLLIIILIILVIDVHISLPAGPSPKPLRSPLCLILPLLPSSSASSTLGCSTTSENRSRASVCASRSTLSSVRAEVYVCDLFCCSLSFETLRSRT